LLEDHAYLHDCRKYEIENDLKCAVQGSNVANEHEEGVVGAGESLLQNAPIYIKLN
jgi:hypothetical protein